MSVELFGYTEDGMTPMSWVNIEMCIRDRSNLTIFDSKIRSIRSSELLLITDILGYDINTSQVLKLLHTDIVSQLNDKPSLPS